VVLAAGPAAATTEVEDVDDGPLGGADGMSTATTTDVEDVDGGPPGGASDRSGSGHH
jgi:hypothetical protein